MPQVCILKNWSIPQPQALSDKTKTVYCYSFGKTQIEHLADNYSQFRENCFSPKKMPQRTAHLVSYTSFTRDVDQHPRQPALTPFSQSTYHQLLASVSGKLPPRKIAPRSGSRFGLGLALELELGGNFPGGNFPRFTFVL